MSNLDRMREDLDRLIIDGDLLYTRMVFDLNPDEVLLVYKKSKDELGKALPKFDSNYQRWYSESLAMLSVLLPDRLADFKACYQHARPPKELNHTTYTISDYLRGTQVASGGSVVVTAKAGRNPMTQQVEIVRAAKARFESSLFDIKAMAQADLFDNELEAAAELNKNGFARGAGAVAGVVLEGHLATVCVNHSVTIGKKKPTIGDFNEALKSANVIDQATWRFIQYLGDIRNACDHKGKDPSREDVEGLVTGVKKISKTVF